MTLPELLADDLVSCMSVAPDGVPRRVLLWLDPEAQFRRLLPLLEPALSALGTRLLRYELGSGADGDSECGQIALKLALLRREAEAGGRAAVYLPGFDRDALEPHANGASPTLWGLYEYRFKGCVWGLEAHWQPGVVPAPPTLLGWLRRHGLVLAEDKTAAELTAGGPDALLSRYAEAQAGRVPDRWPRPLRRSDVLAALGGDPRETLRQLLAAPANEVKRWGLDRPLVLKRIADQFGLDLPKDEQDPEALADTVAVQLALAEAWDAFGRPSDFPFLARLPQREDRRQRQAQFLREDVLNNTLQAPRFVARMRRLEPSYNLATWGIDRVGQPAGLPLLAKARWRRFLDQLAIAMAAGWKVGRDFLIGQRESVEMGAAGPWNGVEGDIQWRVLVDLLALSDAASSAEADCAVNGSIAALVKAYIGAYWEADRLHLRVRAACAAASGLEEVRRLADAVYFACVARTAQRFTDLLEMQSSITWPPTGTNGVETLRKALWHSAPGRSAVIISDALRWDLAAVLSERLQGGGGACTLTPVISTLPSITPFGMAALMPLGAEPLKVELEGSGYVIRPPGGPNLGSRDGRKAFLSARLVGEGSQAGKLRAGFVDLDDLVAGKRIPNAAVVVVFDNRIDEQGHKGPDEFPLLAEQFVANLRRGIERLHEAGIGTVHVVTDHGFLLMPGEAVDGLGRPELLPAQARKKEPRWAALKPDAPVTGVLRLPLPLAPDQGLLGLPRGVRTFVKAEPYLHGGISLQECVIPHLISQRAAATVLLGLDLSVTTTSLSGGVVPVVLRPLLPPGSQPPLGGVPPLTIRLWAETEPEAGAAPKRVTGEELVELRLDVAELKPALYLREGLDLPAGQRLRLRAVEAETGRDLGTIALTLLVDWD